MPSKAKFRKSQLLAPFGIGAIVDLPDDSWMLLGTDYWPEDEDSNVYDERLAKRLRVTNFREPIRSKISMHGERQDMGGGTMPFTRFPSWHYCPSCREMYELGNAGLLGRCKGNHGICNERKKSSNKQNWKGPKLVAIRFILACANGHIDDFPWAQWAHTEDPTDGLSESCTNPKLLFKTNAGAGLAAVTVQCVSCNEKKPRNLSRAGDPNILDKISCSGHRPWLGQRDKVKEKGHIPPSLIQKGATNAYFANIKSSVLIPPFSEDIAKAVTSDAFKNYIADQADKNDEGVWNTLSRTFGYPVNELKLAYDQIELHSQKLTDDPENEDFFRFAEYKAFLSDQSTKPSSKLKTLRCAATDLPSTLQNKISDVILVEKLVETRALTSFSRIRPENDPASGTPSSLSLKPNKGWLPGVQSSGEGVFINFDKTKLSVWAQQQRVITRAKSIFEKANLSSIVNRRSGNGMDPEFLFLHTLSHLLIRQLSFEAGYGSSSIKERIYCSSDEETQMFGILLYTVESGSEGTLGGLVSLGKPNRLGRIIQNAVRTSIACSNDPLCINSSGQGPGSLNLAACHACALLPETSCEEGNALLDRALVIGTVDSPEIGFLSEILSIS